MERPMYKFRLFTLTPYAMDEQILETSAEEMYEKGYDIHNVSSQNKGEFISVLITYKFNLSRHDSDF